MSESLQRVAIRVNTPCGGYPATFCGVSTPADRLRIARARHFKSPRAAAIANEWPESTTRSHEYGPEKADKGGRSYGEEEARKYATAYGVSWKWLLYNESPPAGPQPREIEVDEASPADRVAIIVRTGGRPRYFTAHEMYFTDERRDPKELIGRECVVRLPDGRTLVRTLRKGSKRNVYDLVPRSGEVLKDQQIEWAEPIRGQA